MQFALPRVVTQSMNNSSWRDACTSGDLLSDLALTSPATSSTKITLGVLSNLTTPWKWYQKSKDKKKFRSVYISGLAPFQECLGANFLEEEKRKSKTRRKKTSVLYNAHTVILQCCLQYICLLICSKFAKQVKCTRKYCPNNNLDLILSFKLHRQENLQTPILKSKSHTQMFAIRRHLQSTRSWQDRQNSSKVAFV